MTIKEATFEILDRFVGLRQPGTLQEVWSRVVESHPGAAITSVDRYHRLYRARRPTLERFFGNVQENKR